MEENKKKLSYEELENVAAQLQQENMQFRQMINQINYNNFFKRLDYLFKIVEGKFNEELKNKAIVEIDNIIFGYPQEDKQEK